MSEKINLVKACELLSNTPISKAHRVLEYKNLFVFEVTPALLGNIAVDRDTGNIFGFNPMLNDPDLFFKEWSKHSMDLISLGVI